MIETPELLRLFWGGLYPPCFSCFFYVGVSLLLLLLLMFLDTDDERLLDAVAPDADNSHGKADGGDGGLHDLVLDEGLDLAAHLLTVDVLLELVAAVVAAGALVAVRVAEDLVARLHAPGGALVLAGLSERGPPLLSGGGGRGRGRRSEQRRGDVLGQVRAEAEDRGVD